MRRQVTPEQEARRARIVAAAPEMYEALRALLLTFEQCEVDEYVVAARAAIAKAEVEAWQQKSENVAGA
jgi:nitrate reductase NapAB chaperone NapD